MICNSLEISRVIDNLIRNALLHNLPGITVKLSLAREDENNYRILVQDNGKGIPAEQIDKIFDTGFRIEPKEGEQQPEGQGLGLSIVKSLVESALGKISVESTPGNGCTFKLLLPSLRPGHQPVRLAKTEKNSAMMVPYTKQKPPPGGRHDKNIDH